MPIDFFGEVSRQDSWTWGSQATQKVGIPGVFPLTSYLHGWGEECRRDTVGSLLPRLIKQCMFNAGPPLRGKKRGGDDLGTKPIVTHNRQLVL